jgi:phage virion morphogenesis protein
MFARLRTNRFMKAKGSDSAAVVEFTDRVRRMARVHQYGLKDRPNRNSRDVQYEARPLLGFSSSDEDIINSVILDAISKY